MSSVRLIWLLEERPTAVLRTYDYVDEADALARAYEDGSHVSKEERAVLDPLATMSSADRERFSGLLFSFTTPTPPALALP